MYSRFLQFLPVFHGTAIDTIAPLLAPGAVTALREQAHSYAERVVSVSGEGEVLDYGEPPQYGKLLEFNGLPTFIRNGGDTLPVYMRLLYREYQCPVNYYCWYIEMPSMTFTGGDTLTTFDIWINYD